MKLFKVILSISILINAFSYEANARNVDYGVLAFLNWNHSWNEYKYESDAELRKVIKQIRKLGVSCVRVDFPWSDIEKEKGAFDYERYDRIVRLLNKHDIEILAVVGYSPEWAASSWNMPTENIEELRMFVENLASRYKRKIKYWEFWNEPDSKSYFLKQDAMRTYTRLLKVFYTTLKVIDPESLVLHGGVTTNGYYAIRDIFKNGGGNYFDIANIHPFVNPKRVNFEKELYNKIAALNKLMLKNNKEPRIWITEIGCPGLSKDEEGQTWWNGYAQTENEQAVFLDKALRHLREQAGVERIFWAFFKDNDAHFFNAVDNFGLLRQDGSYKPAFRTYRKIIREE